MTPSYPHAPGHKSRDTETSEAAAVAVAETAKELRERVEAIYAAAPDGLTHDQCAERLWVGALNCAAFERFKLGVRSRGSELKAAGTLAKTPDRRDNASGHVAVVWKHSKFIQRFEPRIQQELL